MFRLTCFASILVLCSGAEAQDQITSIDFYGVRDLSVPSLESAIEVKQGQPLSITASQLEARLKTVSGVEDANVAQIRYPGNLALFIGIRETGQPAMRLRATPTGTVRLQPVLLARYDAIMDLLVPAIKAGKAREDHAAGHSLSAYPPMREQQEKLVAIADERFSSLVEVLQESSDDKSRGAAAYIIAYATDKEAVARQLQLACDDTSSLVRNNAVRALSVLARYAQGNDEANLSISYEPFLQLLNSLEWTDRNKGSAVIDALSVSRHPELLEALKANYLVELEEMARWESAGHALFSIRILARVAGMKEHEITDRSKAAKAHEQRVEWVDQLMKQIQQNSERLGAHDHSPSPPTTHLNPLVIPFTLNNAGNIVVQANVGTTQQAVQLMFHTGISGMGVTEAAAERLTELEFDETANADSWGGGGEMRFARNITLTMHGLSWDNLVVSQSKHSGDNTGGKFGPDLFGDRIIEIDFDQLELRIHERLPAEVANCHRMELIKKNGLLFIPVVLETREGRIEKPVMLHSGFGGAILLDEQFAKVSRITEQLDEIGKRELRDSFDNKLFVRKYGLSRLAIGPYEIAETELEVFDGSAGNQKISILGCAVLSKFHWMIDRKHNVLYLRQR